MHGEDVPRLIGEPRAATKSRASPDRRPAMFSTSDRLPYATMRLSGCSPRWPCSSPAPGWVPRCASRTRCPMTHEAAAHRAGNAGQANAADEADPLAPRRAERRARARQQQPGALVSPSAPPRPTLPYTSRFARNPRAGILFDVDTGDVLWERHPDRRLAIAEPDQDAHGADRRRAPPPGEMVEITPRAGGVLEARASACCPRARTCGSRRCCRGCCWCPGNDAAIASPSATRAMRTSSSSG